VFVHDQPFATLVLKDGSPAERDEVVSARFHDGILLDGSRRPGVLRPQG
jgi:hypothetical protein